MAVKSMDVKVKAEGSSGVAIYFTKEQTEILGLKPGERFQFVYSDKKKKEGGVLSRSLNFNPAQIIAMVLGIGPGEIWKDALRETEESGMPVSVYELPNDEEEGIFATEKSELLVKKRQ